jgi:hypothetical protein
MTDKILQDWKDAENLFTQQHPAGDSMMEINDNAADPTEMTLTSIISPLSQALLLLSGDNTPMPTLSISFLFNDMALHGGVFLEFYIIASRKR